MSKFLGDTRVWTRQTETESYPLKGQRKNGRRGWIVPFYILDIVRTCRGLLEDKAQRRREDLLCAAAVTRLKKSMKWKGNFWRRLMSKHAVLRRRSGRRQFSLVASDFLYCVKFCDEDDISPCFLSWLTVFSCYICQIDLWSWSCTVHIRCTWPATACLQNKPTYHSHKFTSFILLNKKKRKRKVGQ